MRPTARAAVEYELEVRNQPRLGHPGARQPLEGVPLVRLRTRVVHAGGADAWGVPCASTLFLWATLVDADTNDDLPPRAVGGREKLLRGSVVSGLYHFLDPRDRQLSALFVFPGLGVRVHGAFRLKLLLYDIVPDGVEHCASIVTDVFHVVSQIKPSPLPSLAVPYLAAKPAMRMSVKRRLPPAGYHQPYPHQRESPFSTSSLLEYGTVPRPSHQEVYEPPPPPPPPGHLSMPHYSLAGPYQPRVPAYAHSPHEVPLEHYAMQPRRSTGDSSVGSLSMLLHDDGPPLARAD